MSIMGLMGFVVPSRCLYADDILVFYKGNKSYIRALIILFQRYSKVSGQFVNHAKYKLFSVSMTESRFHHIYMLFGFKASTFPFSYIGVPIFKGFPKVTYFRHFVDLIKTKLASYKYSLLTFVSRVQLVKLTVQAMLTHNFSTYYWSIF